MSTTFLPVSENGFLQQNAKSIFSKDFSFGNLRIVLNFTKDKERNWQMEGTATLSNHSYHMHNISPKKLAVDKFYYVGSWKLHIDYFGANINLDPAIPENKLDILANRKLIDISVIQNGLLIKSECMEGTIHITG